jgi:hypothetical protein
MLSQIAIEIGHSFVLGEGEGDFGVQRSDLRQINLDQRDPGILQLMQRISQI